MRKIKTEAMLDNQVIISFASTRLTLREFQKEDISERYLSWLNDADVVRYSEQRHSPHDHNSALQYLTWVAGRKGLFLAIFEDSSKTHIGNISLDFDCRNLTCDMAILIGDKSFWGRGFAKEAWEAARDYVFSKLGYWKITAGTMSVNEGMIRLAKRSGMSLEGVHKDQYLWEGKRVDKLAFAFFNK
ncbi:GNAT family N-acetyltransferase [Flagellimonas sp.]|uniref:GNAT family N-acetyltransferase n=1 Tax=Flagellimonas sp. TaxID=2058762 RepID=UPI003AB7C26A